MTFSAPSRTFNLFFYLRRGSGMWNALRNGSGPHSAAGGYVPSQGWEFVPCSRIERTERGKGKDRNALRRISSPPTLFSHISESRCDRGGAGGTGGTKLEFLKEQMSSGPEAQVQPHTRLKEQMSSETQGQMQQRQLLHTRLKEQMSPEPDNQAQMQQHTRLKKKIEELKKRHVQDKVEWMQDKESLLREVADIQTGENRRLLLDLKTVLEEVQVEVKREEEKRSDLQLQYTRDRCAWELERAELKCRLAQLESKGSTGGVQCAEGSDPAAASCEKRSETPRLRLDEERPLLAAARRSDMELRCRLEHNEKNWLKEKAQLLERFDMERSEWESQLKDMQRKIEELYCEVRAKREGASGRRKEEEEETPSVRSLSSGSGVLSDLSQTQSSGSQLLEPLADIGSETRPTSDTLRRGDLSTGNECGWKDAVNACDFESIFRQSNGNGRATEAVNEEYRCVGESPLLLEWRHASEKKKSPTALNAALKEIARVSEELCSYRDEIQKKSEEKRSSRSERRLSPQKDADKSALRSNEATCDLSQIYNPLQELEHWTALSPDDREKNSTDDVGKSPVAPPVPPRSFSRTPSQTDTELHIPESPPATAKCHGPCLSLDQPYGSPSVVRKFQAMLRENEGKVFRDGAVASYSAPDCEGCSGGGGHKRWSCRPFTGTKLSVQKSFSEANILTRARSASNPAMPPLAKELSVDWLISSPEISPTRPNLQSSRRNVMLEKKTAEFNRTLFQAEVGRHVPQADDCRPEPEPDQCLLPLRCPEDIEDASAAPTSRLPEVKVEPNSGEAATMTNCTSRSVDGRQGSSAGHALSPRSLSEVQKKVQRASGAADEPANPFSRGHHAIKGANVGPLDISLQEPWTGSQIAKAASVSPTERSRPGKLKEHPWKPLTLAAYPRPEGSRSNYGALERILKHYAAEDQTDGMGLKVREQRRPAPPLRLVGQCDDVRQPLQVQDDNRWENMTP
ncbi:protein SOGA3a isoform X2 [Syngnathus acus]|nr:protein SOGA3a isoform X2 [Syngnathus acus]